MSPDTATTHQRDPRTAPRPTPGRAPRRWALAALVAAVVAAACSSTGPAAEPAPGAESGAVAGAAQAGGDELIAGGGGGTERERMLLESLGEDPDVDTVEPDCDGSEAPAGDEDTVRLCFVAFGDPSVDGSGPDKLIEGVRIMVPAGNQPGTDWEKWWKSVHGPAWFAGGGSEDFSYYDLRDAGFWMWPWPGEMVRSTPEGVAGAEVPFVVTGADGTASVTVQRHEPYHFCAVHPDDAGLVAGCSEFDPWVSPWISLADELPANAYGHAVGGNEEVYFRNRSEPQRSVFVYFSRGRAFFDLDLDSGRYGRFLAGDTHPPGTGKVTFTGFHDVQYRGYTEVLVPLGGDDRQLVAVVKDEDIGQFSETVSDAWFEQLEFDSPPTWAPATLLRTGPDGTATADLDAGDYLFCTPYHTAFGDCTYEDVTASQHRILYPYSIESSSWLVELDRTNSVALIKAMAACDTPQETAPCRSRERYEKARQHRQDTGDWPEDW